MRKIELYDIGSDADGQNDDYDATIRQYPVVVELWDRVVTNGSCSARRHRAWRAEFSENERKLARYWYRTFYTWYLRSGRPYERLVTSAQLAFIMRLIRFFGTV